MTMQWGRRGVVQDLRDVRKRLRDVKDELAEQGSAYTRLNAALRKANAERDAANTTVAGAQQAREEAFELANKQRTRAETAEADLATARGRLRDTCQILVACVGADGPTNAEDVARDIVAEVARLKAELAQRGEVRELRAAVKRLLAMSLNGSVRDEMAARTRARKALAAVDAEMPELSKKDTTK